MLLLLPPIFNSTNDCVLIANYSSHLQSCSSQPPQAELANTSAIEGQSTTGWCKQHIAHIGEDNASIASLAQCANHSSSNRLRCPVAAHSLNTPTTRAAMLAARRVLQHAATRRRQFSKFAFVGAGKMAEAMLAPLQETTIEGATPSVSFYDVSCAVAKRVAEKYPQLARAESLDECVNGADVVVLCTKPQNCDAVFADLRPVVQNQKTPPVLLSILAGVPMETFRAGLGLQKVARAMPNTPGQIGCGVTVWTAGEHKELFTDADIERCKGALGALGKEIYVEEESYVDMSTSISGSGPAYIFLLIEAMVDAGVQEGFSREVATTLVHQTILGSVKYAMESGEHPAVLKNSVTSPAGTTASAIYELEKGNFRTVVQDAIWACYRRSLEMGGLDSNVGPGRSAGPKPTTEFPDMNGN